jgi:hypothetical protein
MTHVMNAYAKIGMKAEAERQRAAGEKVNVPNFETERRSAQLSLAKLLLSTGVVTGIGGFSAGRLTSDDSAEAALKAFRNNDAAVTALAEKMSERGVPTTSDEARKFVQVLLEQTTSKESPQVRTR